jgi:4-diphosphocytidyl-2-C-methyl-D-erythritol kinase
MHIASSADGVILSAPAKLNLFLEILGKRADGYHDIETLMVAVDLCDELRLARRGDGQLSLTTRWLVAQQPPSDAVLGDVPTGSSNIVIRALQRLRERAGVSLGAEIQICKRIPSAAGLGGASSDAAAALVGANRIWNLNWPHQKLAEVAAELGSDIPFFLGPPTAICRGRGEIIEPLGGLPPLNVVVARPPVGLSTPAVYRECRPADQALSAVPLVAAWQRGDLRQLCRCMFNRLEAPASSLTPWIARLRDAFRREGCWGYQMSGSGSSYFGICQSAAHARRVARRLQSGGLGYVVHTRTMTVSTGKGCMAA